MFACAADPGERVLFFVHEDRSNRGSVENAVLVWNEWENAGRVEAERWAAAFGALYGGDLDMVAIFLGVEEARARVPSTDNGGHGDRPDGLVSVSKGCSVWTALVDPKIGNAGIDADQIARYGEQAKRLGIDAVITLSNQLAPLPSHAPYATPNRLTDKVRFFHLSWASILTDAALILKDRAPSWSARRHSHAPQAPIGRSPAAPRWLRRSSGYQEAAIILCRAKRRGKHRRCRQSGAPHHWVRHVGQSAPRQKDGQRPHQLADAPIAQNRACRRAHPGALVQPKRADAVSLGGCA